MLAPAPDKKNGAPAPDKKNRAAVAPCQQYFLGSPKCY